MYESEKKSVKPVRESKKHTGEYEAGLYIDITKFLSFHRFNSKDTAFVLS